MHTRLDNFQTNIHASLENTQSPSIDQIIRASKDIVDSDELVVELIYVNLFVLIVGGFISYFLACHSLTPIKKVHDAQSRFTSDTSHELRTPLAVMKTELEVALRDNSATTDSLKQVLSSNLEEVDKLSKLAEMLLNLSQLDNAKLKLDPINLNKITRKMIDDFKQPKNRIDLTAHKQQVVYGNEMAIADLIKVLIDNAIQYSPADSTIHITISQLNDNHTKFKITNTGPGIQPDKIPYIFDRFYQADASRTNKNIKSYGLGLALAKNIAELHNGELSVKSLPDVNTTFTLVLPLNSDVQPKTKK